MPDGEIDHSMDPFHGCGDQVQDLESSKMIAGMAGVGHILVGAGLVLLLLSLRTAIRRA